MINLSALARAQSWREPWTLPSLVRDPDIYYAESLEDFQHAKTTLPFPWYKRENSILGPRAYITIFDVWIAQLPEDSPPWFTVEDASGAAMLYWAPNHPFLGSITFPNDVFRESDNGFVHVFNLFFLYSFEHDLLITAEVSRHRRGPRPPNGNMLDTWLRWLEEAGLIPEPTS